MQCTGWVRLAILLIFFFFLTVENKAVLEYHESRLLLRSHTFAIIVISDLTPYQNLNQRSLTPRWPLTPSLLRSHVWYYPKIIVSKSHENASKCVDTMTLFSKTLNQRSLTPRWPLTSCLLRSHVWLYPRTFVFKSHGNTSMYEDTMINFAKYHTYYVQNEWSHSLFLNKFRRDKN